MPKKPKKEPTRGKMVTGYIIYASEIRKEIIKKHPDKDFGEISKIVGVEWKNLAQESKVNYEKRAQEQNSLSKIQFMASAAAAAAAVAAAQSQHQHSQQSQQPLPQQLSPSQQQPQQQTQPPAYQIFSHSQTQPMPSSQEQSQQSSPQLPYQLFQYPQQPTLVQYCNDPACCASGRYQPYPPYPFSPPAPATTPSSLQQQQQQHHQQQQQQQQLQHFQQSQSPQGSPPLEQCDLYNRNNIIYRRPSLVRLRPKDASTQTDPIAWIEKIEKISPKKELRFSEKFIEHISSLGSGSPDKIIEAPECH